MSKKAQRRFFLVSVPILVNLFIIIGGLILVPTFAQTDLPDGTIVTNNDGVISAHAEILQADNPPPPDELPDVQNTGKENSSNTIKYSLIVTPNIYLKSRQFQPSDQDALDAQKLQLLASEGTDRIHVLVQLDFIPRESAKTEYASQGLQLLAYVPDYAWIASLSTMNLDAASGLTGVTWLGELTVEDKLDPAIRTDQWGDWNLTPDGTAVVNMVLHKDENFDTGYQLASEYSANVKGEVIGINLLILEIPKQRIQDLATEDAVQWIEPVAPPLTEANDGIRDQIGVDAVNAAPYNLDGTGIDVMVYDGGRAGNHIDFGSRLTSGDTASFSEHATHVAGTVGGDGSNSASQGGTVLQWRGMAPNVDLITFGIGSVTGIAFYEDTSDIEADWATGQNTYGADIGTASLSSNIYANYPTSCDLMGNYGSSAVLLDQIVRGGNSVVGMGDKYIATWAAGNERGWGSSCDTYNIVSPPAAAKNPIQVGGSNTNNNTQYIHTSWGPTDDGRIKPIVTAGACQTSGDFGIRSTDNSPVDTYTVKCGTSMATPAVAGGIALMLQHYRDVYNTSTNFWPSTAKAILMQTANDFGNPGPDYQWGYGQVDIHAAVDLISRKAFRQANVNDDEIDVFKFIVPSDTDEVIVSLAWDDYEATFNANPALINNLDLELVAPDGTIWHPWVLDPNNPTTNATRGNDTLNNQEQIQVFTADEEMVGTWLVRVKGTNVPQGPQDYTLVCEGCQPLNIGICQVEVSGTAFNEGHTILTKENIAPNDLLAAPIVEKSLSAGDIWQLSLEDKNDLAKDQTVAEYIAGLEALEKAINQGPEAVVSLLDTLRGPALDQAMNEIMKAMVQLAAWQPPPPETASISVEDELTAAEAQQMVEAANRSQALKLHIFEVKREPGVIHSVPNVVNAPTADHTVGNGCTFSTITAAIAAAQSGDRLLIEGGRTFVENISIGIDLTLEGGYNGCATGSTAVTIIDGNDAARVVTISGDGVDVTMEDLIITNGATTGFAGGGGIYYYSAPIAGTLNLTNVDVYTNTAFVGGGLLIGEGSLVIGLNVDIYENTALGGGGIYLNGGRAEFSGSSAASNSYIRNNQAAVGGGVYGVPYGSHVPILNLPIYTNIEDNTALIGDGLGGGVFMSEGTVSLDEGSDITSNDAVLGGGVYLVTSTLTIASADSEIGNNTATGEGGGVYAQNSTINLNDDAELFLNEAGTDGTGSGGGAYLDDSRINSKKSSIAYNSASTYGGGVYAGNDSTVDMDLGEHACTDVRCSTISHNTAGAYGGGIYATYSYIYLDNTFVENNTGYYGGGIYLLNAPTSAIIYNSLFARNNATANIGDAMRINAGATLSGNGNTIAYNDAGGAGTGSAIDLASSTLTLGCSIIWGHNSSINSPSQNVSYSAIQGGYAGSTNIDENPLFASVASQDYHLQNISPVIDQCPTFAGMLSDFENDPRPIIISQAASPYDMGADEATGTARVGLNGACTYGTIQQAINAANVGDVIRVSTGIYFENVDITDRTLTIEGDYNSSCTTTGGGTTRIEGSIRNQSTLATTNSSISLHNLEIAWGGGSAGGGIQALFGSQITLDNVDVFNNHASYGGGIYISTDSELSVINGFSADNGSEIHHNTASVYGGGVRVWGQFNGNGNYSDIYENCAPHGGGFDVPGGTLNLNASDVYLNQAVNATSQGGGIRVISEGDVTLTNGAFVYYLNRSYDGAGIYADNAQIDLNGGATTLRDNVATNDGGAVYLTNGSTLNSTGARIGQIGSSLANEALRGAGIFANTSTVNFTGGYIINNIAATDGAGVYANDSTLIFDGVQVGGSEAYEANQLGPSGIHGVGFYLNNGTQASLENTIITGNIFQSTGDAQGGGVYLFNGSVLTLTNSTVENHLAPSTASGLGAGLYVFNSTVTLDNSQIISNTAGRLGGGIRALNGSTLNILNGSTIAHNEVLNGEGGGIGAYAGTTSINIQNSILEDNIASLYGGAIYNQISTLIVTHSTFQGNTAERGGAIFQTGTGAQSEIKNTLIHHNTSTANFGAGIRAEEGVFTMTHVTLADNLGGGGYSQMNTDGYATNSIAWGNATAGFWFTSGTLTGACSLDQSGIAGPINDPLFVNAGGENYHLLGGSPAVNACTSGLPTDLAGISRPFGSNFDMGAYEYTAGVTFTPNRSGSAKPATSVSYAHTLTNTGANADTFTLSTSSNQGWSVTLDPTGPLALASGQSTSVNVTITIPVGALLTIVDTTTVTVTSSVDPTLSAAAMDTTQVVPYEIYLPLLLR